MRVISGVEFGDHIVNALGERHIFKAAQHHVIDCRIASKALDGGVDVDGARNIQIADFDFLIWFNHFNLIIIKRYHYYCL